MTTHYRMRRKTMIKIVQVLSLSLFLMLTAFLLGPSVEAQEPVSAEIEALWRDFPIVDGLLEPFDRNGDFPDDFGRIYRNSGVNVFAGKLSSTEERHNNLYNEFQENDTLNFVLDTADLSSRYVNDSQPELLVYVQKPWPIDYSEDTAQDAARNWMANGLRILQLEYSPDSNRALYEAGEQLAGRHSETEDPAPGLTEYGDSVARYLIEHGGIIDVSHSRPETVSDVLTLTRKYIDRRDRAVPVLANHANLNELKEHARNKTLDQACQIASTGGVIGVMPIAGFLPAGADFLSLIDQIDTLRNHSCDPVRMWDGSSINMIDHISVATDTGEDYYDDTHGHYLEGGADRQDRWKYLATKMREDRDNDGQPDFSLEEIRKIFGGNLLRAFRAGLHGQLPFAPHDKDFPSSGDLFTGDFNGDGRDDLLYQGSNGGTWIDYAHRGGEFSGTNWSRADAAAGTDRNWCALTTGRQLFIGDFNGDGRDDLLCHQADGRSWIDYANAQGQFVGTNWSRTGSRTSEDNSWCRISSSRQLYIGDFNGDGRHDLLCHQSDGRSWIDYAGAQGRFSGTDWSRTSTSGDRNWCYISSTRTLFIADLNGDGRSDLLCHQTDGRTWVDYANTQGQFLGTNWSRSSSTTGDQNWCRLTSQRQLYIGDFNDDDRDDLLCHQRNDGRVWIDYADTQGRFMGTNWSDRPEQPDACSGMLNLERVADVNGDNRQDFLCYETTTAALTMFLATSAGELVSELKQ